jgi:hypothetical protein
MTSTLRKPSARTLGDRLRLTSEERHRLAICTIRPFDRTDAELEVQRKRKDAERKWRKRRAAKAKPREAWLANCKTKTKPWEKRGMSRRTWYRKQAKQRTKVAQVGGTGPSAVKLTYCTGQTCAKSESEGGRGLALGAAAPSGGRGLPRKGQGRSPTAKAFGPCIGEGQHEAKKAS